MGSVGSSVSATKTPVTADAFESLRLGQARIRQGEGREGSSAICDCCWIWNYRRTSRDGRRLLFEVSTRSHAQSICINFCIRIHRVINPRHKPRADGRGIRAFHRFLCFIYILFIGGFPVLILHGTYYHLKHGIIHSYFAGLFQSSGSFITSEERSLAFWLSEQYAAKFSDHTVTTRWPRYKIRGYQVFLGNTRGVFDMGHREFVRSDPRFWDWTIRELALYDFPAMVDYVRDATGYDQVRQAVHISVCHGWTSSLRLHSSDTLRATALLSFLYRLACVRT